VPLEEVDAAKTTLSSLARKRTIQARPSGPEPCQDDGHATKLRTAQEATALPCGKVLGYLIKCSALLDTLASELSPDLSPSTLLLTVLFSLHW
jgi:hypothetical protein